jgi:DNA primase
MKIYREIPSPHFLMVSDRTGEFICFGGSEVKSAKLETLKRAGARVLYLSFDHDQAGKKATKEAIKHAEKLALCPFIVNLPAGVDLNQTNNYEINI